MIALPKQETWEVWILWREPRSPVLRSAKRHSRLIFVGVQLLIVNREGIGFWELKKSNVHAFYIT